MYRLTEEGKEYLQKGLPEKKLLQLLKDGRKNIVGIVLPKKDIAIGWAKKNNWISIKYGFLELTENGRKALNEKLELEKALASIEKTGSCDKKFVKTLEGRKLVQEAKEKPNEEKEKLVDKIKVIFWQRKEKHLKEVAQLTPDIIKTGRWKKTPFRKYDVNAPAPAIYPGKKQAYKAFLDFVKQELVALGFEEMCGPLVELSFFNMDALFMPQDHSARGIHDLYFVKPEYGSVEKYKEAVSKVKATHENGWKTGSKGWQIPFSEKESSKLVLRSQGTAISARMILNPKVKIPGSYFSLARCYRPEKLDATHLTEFNQLEGIVLGKEVNFRNLLGLLAEFAKKIAETDKIKFRPAYFPFTEPSVQGMIWHKELKQWLEILPAGIFRPEVVMPLGIDVPVLAWGIGIDRLFMVREGITDIRKLFSNDISWLREVKV